MNDRLHALIEALQHRDCFDHPVTCFELVETHISYVLLTGPYAYKFKKPLNLGFLDFSTLEKRKHYCEEELRLNKQLAPQIYDRVIAITGPADRPQIDGAGDLLEYGVKMVQFDAENELVQVLNAGGLTSRHIDRLAELLADFHGRIAVADSSDEYGSPDAIRHFAMDNYAHSRSFMDESDPYFQRLDEVESWTAESFDRLRDTFVARKRDGFIRECHGDVHLGNIALYNNELVIFDCIEFSPQLHWIDVISEVAFLVMDLDARGQKTFARRVLNHYLELTGDYAALSVLQFYLVYRAMVRCKVAFIRQGQADMQKEERQRERQQAYQYLDLARSYTKTAPPVLLLTHGLSGSGKSFVTEQVLEQLPAIRVRSDVERKRLHGLAAGATTKSGLDEGIYNRTSSEQTYRRLADVASAILAAGHSAIVDATFLQAWQRQLLRDVAVNAGSPFVILDFYAEEQQLRRRIGERLKTSRDPSEADLEVLDHQIAEREPLQEAEMNLCISIDTGREWRLAEIIDRIKMHR